MIYWDSKRGFLEGVKKSQKNRWKKLIRTTLVPMLNEEEKKDFRKLFDWFFRLQVFSCTGFLVF